MSKRNDIRVSDIPDNIHETLKKEAKKNFRTIGNEALLFIIAGMKANKVKLNTPDSE